MRIAVPQWQGRVSPVFDVAGKLVIADFDDGRDLRREEVRLARTDESGRAAELARLGVDVLICGAISATLESRLTAAGVRVIGFICGVVEEILAGFLNGELAHPVFRMPGCRRSRRGRMGPRPAGGSVGECVCPRCGTPLSKKT